MKARCFNPNLPEYENYGGRGIKVCKRWLKFENFLADMGLKPKPTLTLDRINNDGNYEPNNCRWATKKEQYENRRVRKIENFSTYTLLKELRRRGIKGFLGHEIAT